MSKTVLCVLLKVLMLARADILSMDPDSDFIQDIPVSENNDHHILQNLKSDRNHLDNASVRNKVDEIPFANMSMIPESIESILSKPTSPRAFVEFHNEFLNEDDDISVTFRWNQPEFTDEVIQGYTVQCWFIENLKKIQICNEKSISAIILECTVHNLKPNTTYYFQVRAHNKVGAGPYTDLIDVSTTHENPIPQLLIVTQNGIYILDLDSNTNINLVEDRDVISAAYSIAEHKIYWSSATEGLMMLEMNENNITKIAKFQEIPDNLCIDWVARNLYWTEDDGYQSYNIIKFDLTMWENGIVKYDKILKVKNKLYHDISLNILPSIGTLYWRNNTEYNEVQVMQLDLDGKNARIFQKNISICPFIVDMSRFNDMKIDDINTKKPLIYWLFDNFLFVTDVNVSICNLILQIKDIYIVLQSLAIDKTNIYIKDIMENDYLYVLKKKYALLESVDAFKYIHRIRAPFWIHKFYAFGKSLQSYPPIRCLTPDNKIYNVEESIYTVTTNSIIVNLPEPVPKSGCKNNLPTTLYTINISYCLDNELNKFDNFTVQAYERYYEIQNLTPLTEYKLQLVRISNFYSDQLSMDPLFSSEVMLRTKPNKLDAPENVTVQALTPTAAIVYWMPPKKLNCASVIYKIYWTLITSSMREISNSLLINKTEHKVNYTFSIIEPLIPAQKYKVYVRIYPLNYSELYTDSLSKTLYMYSEPNNITLNEVSINGMNISWIPSINLTINYELEYKNVEMQKWQIANNSEPNNGGRVMYYIKNLLPGTLYEFRLILKYPRYEKNFTWPSDGRFTFTTLTISDSTLSKSTSPRASVKFYNGFLNEKDDISVTLRWNQPEFTDKNLTSDWSHPDNVSVRNEIDEISFTNMSVIPESIDSTLRKPTSLRAFVEFYNGFLNKEDDISVTFRPNQPEFTDKVIQGYTVRYCFIENQKEIQICDDKNISATILECTVHNLKSNTTYYFQVRAHTNVGAGPYTNLFNVSTTHENPIPRLLMVTGNGIDILDLDSNTSISLVKDRYVTSAAYSIAEHKIYWSNKERELMISEMNEKNITKIAKLQNIARNLCIDWITRNLYWMESDYISGFGDIVRLDLTMWENGIVKYDKISKIKTYLNIDRLTILPSIGTLYWTNHSMDNKCQIIQSDLDGKNARIFQNNSFIMCLLQSSLHMSDHLVDMKIDDMNTKEPLVYWLWSDFLFVTDINVSMCNLILQVDNITKTEEHKINFQSLTIDKTNIYISIALNKNIYVLKKEYALLTSEDAFKYIEKKTASSWINNLYAFGKSLQSCPPRRCLTPDKKVYNVEILKQYYLSFLLSSVAIVTGICVCYFYYLYRQRKESNEQVLPSIMTDIELDTSHQIPNVSNVQMLNMLYSPMLEHNSDKYALTEIKRKEIRLGKLLGSGAFGMEFQAKVKNLERPGTEISAAIKMLRENASSQDKEKFLEEAKLMNHFRHKHVLRLLGVCLDGENAPLIVLELMEIDLLQYLRDSQKLQPSDSHALRLQDLFAMCEDVARGCCYLEDLRVVHRNLACHTCLVSARNRENRVVKIGNFALARDISEKDLYRLVLMGCLPIRWMAPESLVVGIFTSQSDVWSFGVLMWEITSLGEHPYTGRTNQEVIYYIRAGGRLPMPLNCPPTLYELMLRCWSPANDRPNFNFCLENIIALRNNMEDTLLSPVDIM